MVSHKSSLYSIEELLACRFIAAVFFKDRAQFRLTKLQGTSGSTNGNSPLDLLEVASCTNWCAYAIQANIRISMDFGNSCYLTQVTGGAALPRMVIDTPRKPNSPKPASLYIAFWCVVALDQDKTKGCFCCHAKCSLLLVLE